MPVYLRCQVCNREFGVPPSRAETAKACSNECARQIRGLSNQKRVTLNCPNCRNDFEVPKCHEDRRKFCSNECREANELYQREKAARYLGAGNPGWKGGRHVRTDGYIYRHVGAEHPFSGRYGYILEHRKVMEDWLRENDPDSRFLVQLGEKKYLSPSIEVHHEDNDRTNNDQQNLRCLTPADHRKLHSRQRRLLKATEKKPRAAS